MRIFIGIRPSDEFRAALALLEDRLRDAGVTGRYLDPSNLHLTLAFIGEWPEDVTEVLPEVDRPFSLVLSHLGYFPEAKVLWAGLEQSGELERLAGRVRRSLAEAGIPFDRKRFAPHITFVRRAEKGNRWRTGVSPKGDMVVNHVSLMRSDRGKNGMIYTELS